MGRIYRVTGIDITSLGAMSVTYQGNKIGRVIIHDDKNIDIYVDDMYVPWFESTVCPIDTKSFNLEVRVNAK